MNLFVLNNIVCSEQNQMYFVKHTNNSNYVIFVVTYFFKNHGNYVIFVVTYFYKNHGNYEIFSNYVIMKISYDIRAAYLKFDKLLPRMRLSMCPL